ncbi:MAG TPA: hypothetical protein VMV19_10270 [Xanthobacteraceae bacterium]|nr:hypothetical protein [Xanthobacteraceae bacterium]
MPFDTFSERLKLVADESLALCKQEWGRNGLGIEIPIAPKIGWQPTFYMKPNRVLMVAVEVGDRLFPDSLRGAAHDIEHYDFPISVYQACAFDIYQHDPHHDRVDALRDHGFGIITVDGSGRAVIQTRAEPLAQHLSQKRLDDVLKPLTPTPTLKVRFRAAYATYCANVGQGLQAAAQIVESMVVCIAGQAERAGVVPPGTSGKDAALIIDDLYPTGLCHNYRAALGGARNFIRQYRNIASHPARTPRAEADRIRNCKTGFLEAARIACELRDLIRGVGYRVLVV